MPQIFPMNWIILSSMFSLSILVSYIYIFYIPMKLKKFTPSPTPNKNLFLKW
nr:ATP synthase F0 subunit 8 [Ixodes (Pholeoixodes) sp.]